MELKPKFNLKWYKNLDNYSDGDVEEDIIKYILENPPEDYGKVILEHYCWPVYYHLTHTRQNILNWYPFKQDASILEIGCGLGAVTGLLCNKCKAVTAVELSKRRATAALLRCREKDNLEIIVGNLNDIEFDRKFDYITLIGVLEYQGTYTESENPYKDFLLKVKTLLKEDGKLLIAIENKYGMKYWCGAAEDHTGIPFDGINQYQMSGSKVRTFAKEELRKLLIESGFINQYFYFPMPDYKLPMVIYSENSLPENEALENAFPYYIHSDGTLLIEEEGLYKDIIRNNVFDFFANSFLVECSLSPIENEEQRVTFALLNSKRQSEYRVGTIISASGHVVKFPLNDNIYVKSHLVDVVKNMENMERRGLKILPYKLEGENLVSEYQELSLLENLMCEASARKDTDLLWSLWDELLRQIEMASDEVEQKTCMIYELGIDTYAENKNYGKIVKEGYLDMIPRNAFVKEDELLWFDQEWALDNVPSKYILFRGMLQTYIRFPIMRYSIPVQEWLEHYGIHMYFHEFLSFDKLFTKMVMDQYYAGYIAEHREKDIYEKNIMKLL